MIHSIKTYYLNSQILHGMVIAAVTLVWHLSNLYASKFRGLQVSQYPPHTYINY